MRHVDLDPVGSVIKLLASSLASLYRTIDELRAFRYVDLRCIALEGIAAGG
jgi:hypothetical protein